jgi:hypothetical protein
MATTTPPTLCELATAVLLAVLLFSLPEMRAFEPPTRSSPPFPSLTDRRAAVPVSDRPSRRRLELCCDAPGFRPG